MKTLLALSISVAFALFSCNPASQEDAELEGTPVKGGPVVVSFKNPQDIENKFYFFFEQSNDTTWVGQERLATLFYDNSETYLNFEQDKKPEAISIFPSNDFVIFKHSADFFDNNYYILQKGDSLFIEYKNKKPILTVSNRITPKQEFNIDELVRAHFKSDKYSPIGKYSNINSINLQKIMRSKRLMDEAGKLSPERIMDRNIKNRSELRNQLYSEVQIYLKTENRILDSLNKLNEISKAAYHFHKEKNKYLAYLIDMETDRMSESQITEILKNHQINSYGYPDIYYQQFLGSVANKFIVEKADFMHIKDGTNRNYRQVFNQIDTSSLFPEKDRNYLLTKEIKRIHDAFIHDDFITYFKAYEEKVKDTSLVNGVRQDFALEFDDRRSETASVVLTDLGGKKMTFDDVKARHKGKVIYVDFWASWCGPCREAMPASADLRKVLKDKKVVFVYLSIDGSIKPWQKASTAENLHNYAENYLIVNTSTSDFLKQNKLSSIPRYMIFDKTGRLTHANAPRVESGGVGLLLTSLADKP